MNEANKDKDLKSMTTTIVASYLANKPLQVSEIPTLIAQVYNTLASLGDAPVPVAEERPDPAVSIRKSITPDYLVCLEDGKKLKMLKRHLKTSYNLTPDEYRERWGLASDYPMVAPNYAIQRSKLAKQIGLGTVARRRDS
jgi:predicted transcriptional regulator